MADSTSWSCTVQEHNVTVEVQGANGTRVATTQVLPGFNNCTFFLSGMPSTATGIPTGVATGVATGPNTSNTADKGPDPGMVAGVVVVILGVLGPSIGLVIWTVRRRRLRREMQECIQRTAQMPPGIEEQALPYAPASAGAPGGVTYGARLDAPLPEEREAAPAMHYTPPDYDPTDMRATPRYSNNR